MNYDHPISKHWQLAPHGQGADVLRPDFGSNHFDYLDTPEDVFVPNVVREVMLSIQTWEKRAIVERVRFSGNAPHITMIVEWRVADDIVSELYQTQIFIG